MNIHSILPVLVTRPRRTYLDHAAATPVDPRVLRAMHPYLTNEFGNPSAIHTEGLHARTAVERARERVARTLGVRTSDVTFTSGGTESNNLALRGFVSACLKRGMKLDEIEIISMRTEHPSILRTLETLAGEGCTVTYVAVNDGGRVDIQAFERALSPKTKLVTFAYANSETGVVQDMSRIGRMIETFERTHNVTIAFHTDASQAPLWLPVQCAPLRTTMMTLDAGKFCGPKGVGILVHRPGVTLAPVVVGGSQEDELRPGTESVAGIVGAAEALVIAQTEWERRSRAVAQVRNYGIETLESIEGLVVNGSRDFRLANNINISIPGFDSEFAVVTLDAKGIACSTKSACSGAGGGMSSVVYEMTQDPARASSTIRLTLGEKTTKKDMDKVVRVLREHLHRMNIFKAV